MSLDAAALCREVLDQGGLPTDSSDWQTLRNAFDVQAGQEIFDTIVLWDNLCRTVDVDLQTNQDDYVKLGIVTWTIKFIAKWLGMLPGSKRIDDFDEWKHRLQKCLDEYIIVRRT